MAFQVISDPHRSLAASLGASLGGAGGSFLGSGLESLAQNKMKEIQSGRLAKGLESLLPGQSPEQLKNLAGLPPELLSVVLKQKLQEPQQQAYAQALQGLLKDEGVAEQPTNITSKQGVGAPLQLNQQQATALANLEMQKKKIAQREREFVEKRIAPEAEELREKYKSSHDRRVALNTILAEARSGKLRSPRNQAILNKLGLSDLFTGNVETQLAQSAMNELATNAGTAFNTKNLTNLDVNLYKRRIPSLLNTDEGKEVIAKNMLLSEDANDLRYKEYQKLYRQGATEDIFDRVEQNIEPQLKKLANEAMSNVLTVDFPPANTYKNDSIVRDPETGYVFKINKNKYEIIESPEEVLNA